MTNYSVRQHSVRGFTIVELIVVLTVILVLSVLSVQAYLSFQTSRKVGLAADSLVTILSAARSQAVSLQVPCRVVVQLRNPVTGTPEVAFWTDELEEGATPPAYPTADELGVGVRRAQIHGVTRPPTGIVVSEITADESSSAPPSSSSTRYASIMFYPSGSASYASIRLEDTGASEADTRTKTVKVYPATGRAHVVGGSL